MANGAQAASSMRAKLGNPSLHGCVTGESWHENQPGLNPWELVTTEATRVEGTTSKDWQPSPAICPAPALIHQPQLQALSFRPVPRLTQPALD